MAELKRDKIWHFLMDIKTSISMGKDCDETYAEILKRYGFDHMALIALRACHFIRTNGWGFENWDWIKITPISSVDVDRFVGEIERQKAFERGINDR